MESKTPRWLTEHFIQNALQSGKDYTVEIDNLKINRPVAKGENYGSSIYGALVQYRKSKDLNQLHEVSLIIKAPIEGPNYENTIKLGIFRRESVIYYELSKKFKKIFADIGDLDIMPEVYPSSVENVLILEDLKSKGYFVVDRLKRLDYDQCVVTLKGLARFHACSVILHTQEPEFIENVGTEFLHNEDTVDKHTASMASNFRTLESVLKQLPEFEKYVQWFYINAEKAYDLIVNSIVRNDNDFKVLNHGDFWITNILIKNDENLAPKNVKLIDFPMTRYNSPALDFWFFMDGSVQENVRTEKFDDLINVYLNELNSLLERLGNEKRLERSNFEKSLINRVNFRIVSNFLILPLAIADPNEVKLIEPEKESAENSEDSAGSGGNPMVEYYKNKEFLKLLKKRLEDLEEWNVITT